MENFFLDEKFCSDIEDLANTLEIDEDNVGSDFSGVGGFVQVTNVEKSNFK